MKIEDIKTPKGLYIMDCARTLWSSLVEEISAKNEITVVKLKKGFACCFKLNDVCCLISDSSEVNLLYVDGVDHQKDELYLRDFKDGDVIITYRYIGSDRVDTNAETP